VREAYRREKKAYGGAGASQYLVKFMEHFNKL